MKPCPQEKRRNGWELIHWWKVRQRWTAGCWKMSRRLPLLTERIPEWWVEQEELLQNDEKPRLQPLRLASPKAEKVANSLLASLVKQKLRRLLDRVKELPLTRSVAYVLRQVSDLRLSLPVHYPVDWNEKTPGSVHYEGEF